MKIRAGSGGSAITQGKKKGNIYVGALAIFVIEDFIKVSSDKQPCHFVLNKMYMNFRLNF